MLNPFDVEVSYGQLAVFASSLEQPFNDWTKRHFSQGFTWRPGSVSFRSLVDGKHLIEMDVKDHVDALHGDAIRVVDVPFEVPADGAVEIGSISETVSVSLPVGHFLLRCEFMQPGAASGARVRLTFAKADAPRFELVRADSELSVHDELLLTAKPASCD